MRQERPFSFHTIFQFCENSLSWPLWFDIFISSPEPASSVKPYACQIILISYGFACDKYDLNLLHPSQKVRRQLITVHRRILWLRHIMTLDINYFNLTLETRNPSCFTKSWFIISLHWYFLSQFENFGLCR